MSLKPNKRSATTSAEDDSISDSVSTRDEEKTIPFLRRLTDMLIENENVIYFKPGCRKNGILGQLVIRDRLKVESTILPRYFNHSSFASLRRQLNYFNFTRIGKGRQRGAAYTNVGVIELDDILSLKRRSVRSDSPNGSTGSDPPNEKPGQAVAKNKKGNDSTGNRSKEGVHSGTKKSLQVVKSQDVVCSKKKQNKGVGANTNEKNELTPCATRTGPKRVSPVDHFDTIEEPPTKKISLDLTRPASGNPDIFTITAHRDLAVSNGDDDILAGCRALLCFSRGIPSR